MLFALTIVLCTEQGECAPLDHDQTYKTMGECLDAAVFAFKYVDPKFQEMAKTIKCEQIGDS